MFKILSAFILLFAFSNVNASDELCKESKSITPIGSYSLLVNYGAKFGAVDNKHRIFYDVLLDSEEYPEVFKTFVILHECAHIKLNHLEGSFTDSEFIATENDADCHAAKVFSKTYTKYDLYQVISMMRLTMQSHGSDVHASVDYRIQNMLSCYGK